MSTEDTGKKETDVLNDEELRIFNKVKGKGLSISVSDTKKKQNCAYEGCKNSVCFYMEELLVCITHAEKLLKCFVPEK